MKVQIQKEVIHDNPKNIWRVNIKTMTGDADGYNHFSLDYNDSIAGRELLHDTVRYCEVMAKQYPRGRGGGSGYYDHLEFFDGTFDEEWYYEDGEYMDDFESYTVSFFDQAGREFTTEAFYNDLDLDIISSYEVKD